MRGAPGRPAEALAVLMAAVAIWELLVTIGRMPPYLIPSPAAAAEAFAQHWPHVLRALALTLRNALAGMAIAGLAAVALAVLVSSSRFLTAAILPPLLFLRTAPTIAVMPLLILLFGRGLGTALLVVGITSFFPMFIAGLRGLTSVGRDYLDLMHQLAAPAWLVMLKLRLPASLPFVFAAARSSITAAVLTAMLAEWLSGVPGIGALVLTASSTRMTALVWAIMCITTLTSMLLTEILAFLERTWDRRAS